MAVAAALAAYTSAAKTKSMCLKLFFHSAVLATIVVLLIKLAGCGERLQQDRCLVKVPRLLQNAFVPPFNCSQCEGLDEVPWILSNETDGNTHW